MKYRHRFTDEEFLTGIFRDKLRRNLSVFTERDSCKFFDGNHYTILICASAATLHFINNFKALFTI